MDEATREYYSVMCDETNPIGDIKAFLAKITNKQERVQLSDKDLIKIVRLRIVGYCWDFPQWDISYCVGQMSDGRFAYVDLGVDSLGKNYKRELVELCKESGRFGKSMGIFEAISTLPG